MIRKIKFGFIILIIAISIIFIAAPAMAAGQPLAVKIVDAEHDIDGKHGTFIATGQAVDAGLVCEAGIVYDTLINSSGPPGGTLRILKVHKNFVCNDGSGTFDVKMVVRLDLLTGNTTANWIITGGTEDYAALKGNGKLIGTSVVLEEIITDVYNGAMH